MSCDKEIQVEDGVRQRSYVWSKVRGICGLAADRGVKHPSARTKNIVKYLISEYE